MLLIMIKLKSCIPSVVNSALKSQLFRLYESSNTLKEYELLLRLFISSLPPSTVLQEINKNSSSSLAVIRSLCYIPINDLLELYICCEESLLKNRTSSVLKGVLDLISSISEKCEPYQRRRLISALFSEIDQCEEGSDDILKTVYGILINTFYIIGSKEIDLLLSLYANDSFRDLVVSVFYKCVLEHMEDVKYVAKMCMKVDASK